MSDELTVQTRIIKGTRAQGGFGIKLSNRFSVGIPDLLLALPPFAPCLVEVKDLGECVENFDRKLEVTPKQGLTLDQFSDPYNSLSFPVHAGLDLSFVFVAIRWCGVHQLVGLPKNARRLTSGLALVSPRVTRLPGVAGSDPTYDIRPLLEGLHARRVQ